MKAQNTKNICFYSTGFAFNRLNRMKYYENIMPENVNMFLFTSNKYEGKEKENYQYRWDLKRTKLVVGNYGNTLLPELRFLCKKEKIHNVINIGNWKAGLLLWFSTLGIETRYIMNIFGDVISKTHNFKEKTIRKMIFLPLVTLSKITTFNDTYYYEKYEKLFGKKIKYLPVTINTDLFKPRDKIKARKKLNLPIKKKIILTVGRINYQKGSDILIELIKKNPDILFVAVGRAMDENFKNLLKNKHKNLIYHEKKNSEELVDFYNAADLGFFVQRYEGGGLGSTSEECLACGVPAVNRYWKGVIKSPALTTVQVNTEKSQKAIDDFFKKSEKERKSLRKIAREYALKNYSNNTWKNHYVRAYLD